MKGTEKQIAYAYDLIAKLKTHYTAITDTELYTQERDEFDRSYGLLFWRLMQELESDKATASDIIAMYRGINNARPCDDETALNNFETLVWERVWQHAQCGNKLAKKISLSDEYQSQIER